MILSSRPNDEDSHDGFTKWPFMSTHPWAEYPRGKWSLEVIRNSKRTLTHQAYLFQTWKLDIKSHSFISYFQVRFANQAERRNRGFLKEWTLMLHGTRDAPYSDLPVTDPHSKLAVVKKAHEDKKKM